MNGNNLSNYNNLAVIPARGGSKRIPRKNIKDFLGKPIIAYSIDAALKSELFTEVIVSTDDSEITEIAIKYGAKVPFTRSKKNADDYATTADVLIEVINEYKKKEMEFNNLCCIYPTAPFITAQKLIESFSLMTSYNKNGVVSVVKFNYPIQRALRINDKNQLEYIWPENINKRSQDLEPTYHDAGQFYWINIKKFLQNKTLISENILPYILSETEVQDIDNLDDWNIALAKFSSK